MSWALHSCDRFAEHAAAWDVLQRATTDTPFLESAFLLPLLQQFGSGRELLALHHGPRGLDAAVIVAPTGRGQWQTFQPSQLPLGPWIATAGDDLRARARSLMQALPGLALLLGVTQLDPRLQARPDDSAVLRLLDYIDTSYIDIEGSFDAYWDARGKNLRQNTRKQRNKLQGDGIEPALDCVSDPAGVDEALAQYGTLEAAGWKAGGGTAIHPDNAQGRFYAQMLRNFCTMGRGRIYRYRFGDAVVSMDLCIDNGPLVVVLKTTYDEAWKAVSPSTLMRQDEFREWWQEGRYRRIEFYGKTMEWHTRWTAQQRRLYHATAYRWPLLRRVHEQVQSRRAERAEAVPANPAPAAAAAPIGASAGTAP